MTCRQSVAPGALLDVSLGGRPACAVRRICRIDSLLQARRTGRDARVPERCHRGRERSTVCWRNSSCCAWHVRVAHHALKERLQEVREAGEGVGQGVSDGAAASERLLHRTRHRLCYRCPVRVQQGYFPTRLHTCTTRVSCCPFLPPFGVNAIEIYHSVSVLQRVSCPAAVLGALARPSRV